MSGHNKWANIKHRKSAQDAKRSKMFTKIIRELMVAAREGGTDPNTNNSLKSAIERAKSVNMPKDTMEKAIKKGAGELEGQSFVEVIYEGYAPGGVAMLIRALTDNKNRTAQELRHLLSKYGGNMAESGSVAWMFERKGVVSVPVSEISEMEEFELMVIEAGAEDIKTDDEMVRIITEPESVSSARSILEENGFTVTNELTYIPKNSISVEGNDAERMLKLLSIIEDCDDVQEVFSNFEMDDAELEAIMERIG
ncbi:MAG TPA: YebC/PmpR family DNA-binding transcriptional regulator [Kosmotogaceae bacterium]|nr:MAG: putative transcriptional regulatory protein [Thermotogales bacterium 46_20]HAA85470.1 YebC/PmpR family DNA-binding transcriptional regulator [Kosmotogaceae bacterium]